MLGTPALFATAYGNVGSSIYYALGLTAVYALGLTPLVFLVAGVIFAATAATYAEGTVHYPEAGGSASFARHGFNELISFGAAWAQMLVYIVTVATSAFFVPHYLSIFWEPLKTNPWDIVGGAAVIVILVALNIVGVQEAAKLSITLAVVDFATQVLLVILGFALVFSPDILTGNIHWGVAPTWGNLAIAIPVAMLAYTGVETVSNLAEEAREPSRSVPDAYKLVAGAVFAIYLTLPLIALSALPVKLIDGELTTLLALPPEQGGLRERPDPGRCRQPRRGGRAARGARDLRRRPRRHDPLHRHECGRHRRLAHHLLDVQLPAVARDLPPPAPDLQDARALARPLRRYRADPDHPARQHQIRGHPLLVRCNAVVHGCAFLSRTTAHETEGARRGALPCAPEPPCGRHRLAGVRDRRWPCDGNLVPRHPRPEPDDALGRARVARRRRRLLRGVPAAVRRGEPDGHREGAARVRAGACAPVPAPARSHRHRAAVGRRSRCRVQPRIRAAARAFWR